VSSVKTLIAENVSLADKTWFKTGGSARFYCQPTNTREFQEAVISVSKMPIFVLGDGANILISDDGFDGLVIHPKLMGIDIAGQEGTSVYVRAEAGVSFASLITYCLEHNLVGLEEFSGIPGTVGGAVFINIHYFEFLLSNFLHSGSVLNRSDGALLDVDHRWFNFGYNYSTLHTENYYLTSATFKLRKASDIETAYARGRHEEIIRHRTRRYPHERTCGSFFRNFFEHEISAQGKKIIYVAYYLDKLGIKGDLSVGGATVSHKHANMIVSSPGCTSHDIITLARMMQDLTQKTFGLVPQPECRLIGFSKNPLL
jgi:UDP-N-acetylmuramate dehydrogenase